MPRARLLGRFAAITTAAALLLGGLAGCSGASEPAGRTAGDGADGLAASVKQGRLDIAARRLVVHLDNDGARAVTIARVEFDSPTLAEPLVRTKPVDLAPGAGIDLRFDLAEADCGAGPDAEEGARVVLAVEASAGERTVELVPADPFGTLPRIHDDECFAARVAEVATLSLVEPLRVTGTGAEQRAVIEIAVDPRSGASDPADASGAGLTIERVLGTTLLAAEETGGDWPVDRPVSVDDAPFTLELPVRPSRCDAHAIADDKRGTIMRLEISEGATTGLVELVAGPELKAALYAYYGERCGLA